MLLIPRIRRASKSQNRLSQSPLVDGFTPTREFVGEIVATKNAVWVGYDLGGAMANNLMLLVWLNGNNFVYSTRMATYVLEELVCAETDPFYQWLCDSGPICWTSRYSTRIFRGKCYTLEVRL